MTPPFTEPSGLLPGRRRAEELAAALDGRLPADAVGEKVTALVGVATALRSVQPVQPRPEFTAELRARLMEEAQTLLGPEVQKLRVPPRAKGARERRLVAVAAAVLMIGGTASVAAASQSALPGQALYPIKRGIEQAQADIASTPAGKGRTLLGQAGDRLDEVAALLADPPANGTEVSTTLADFGSEARDGAGLLLGSYRTSGDRGSVDAVRLFAAQGMRRLDALAGTAPGSSRQAFAAAALTLRDLDAQASRLCSTCSMNLPPLRVPKLLLVRAEVQQALRRAGATKLDNSHPVVVPRRAGETGPAGAGAVVPGHLRTRTGAGTGSEGTPAPPSPSVSPVPSGSPAPTGLPGGLLPSQSPTSGSSGLTGTLDGTLDGVSGAATTLLPDLSSPDNLLP